MLRASTRRHAATELDAAREAMRRAAVETFVGTDRQADPWLTSSSPNEAAIRLSMIDFAAGTTRNLLDELRTAKANREENLRAGEEARAEADALRLVLEDELAELEARRDTQARIQAELQARIAAWQDKADTLADEAEDMTALIRQKQIEALGFAPGDPGAASVEGFIMPTRGEVGSGFGYRIHPIFRSRHAHRGRHRCPYDQLVWAAKAGRVIFAGRKGGYGNAVVIQHEGNVATLYGHLNSFQSSEGDWVEAGDVIGLVGSTGRSTGPHLHFEVRIDGVPKDPQLFLPS
ncbi:MAG: peptidoglycan DD-metalloendopeptidase family protein [Acidimicrobiales bacterium]